MILSTNIKLIDIHMRIHMWSTAYHECVVYSDSIVPIIELCPEDQGWANCGETRNPQKPFTSTKMSATNMTLRACPD